ncbi:hypothetical protein PJM41_0009 [Salmonella phage vB_SenS_UTK0009]|uniref:Uncharacterized protein n=1 Tax=Salmonella phage vB_SenS_UTK0009 TaxID=3028908 RepID=A0AAE9ZFV2_9CAUD|nr:hypothetical protein PJM41_0009 [Salmonella phage vB_SenS_UTK0009]
MKKLLAKLVICVLFARLFPLNLGNRWTLFFFTFLYKNKVAPIWGITYYLSRRTAGRKRNARIQGGKLKRHAL